jgi:hypothetical protein
MGKKMCEEKKKGDKKEKKSSRFECKKCGSKAVKEKHLCKPEKL